MQDEGYAEKAGQIRQLASMPTDQFAEHLSNLHNTLDSVAPNIAPHVFAAASNAVHFLNSKLPNGGNELPQDQVPEPSQAQKTAWMDLHNTVNSPLSVLDHVNNGTLNSHHLEAMQSVYPDIHKEIIQKTMEHLGNLKNKGVQLPYAQRQSISKFIGQPLDSTMTQQSMQTIIQSASQNTGPAAQANQMAKGSKKASGPELTQIDKVTKLYQTPSQARQTEK